MREVDEKVLVSGVYAMLGKVRRIGIVQKVVQRRDDRRVVDAGKGKLAWGIERRVHADGNASCKEGECNEEDEGEWSGLALARILTRTTECTHLRLKCGNKLNTGKSK